jgi:hypothetical protein
LKKLNLYAPRYDACAFSFPRILAQDWSPGQWIVRKLIWRVEFFVITGLCLSVGEGARNARVQGTVMRS